MITDNEVFHSLIDVFVLIVASAFSRMLLLAILFCQLTGFINLQCGGVSKFSLWSFNAVKASLLEMFCILCSVFSV